MNPNVWEYLVVVGMPSCILYYYEHQNLVDNQYQSQGVSQYFHMWDQNSEYEWMDICHKCFLPTAKHWNLSVLACILFILNHSISSFESVSKVDISASKSGLQNERVLSSA